MNTAVFVQQLPGPVINRIKRELIKEDSFNSRSNNEEDIVNTALSSRLCDLENTIDISKVVNELVFWKELGRDVGEIAIGDTIWDCNGNLFLVLRNPSRVGTVSLSDAKAMYEDGSLLHLSVDEEILTLSWFME